MRSLAPALALLTVACSGNAEVTGTVSDLLSGNGVDAQVCATSDVCTETESDGSYSLKVPSPSILSLRVTSNSYAPVAVPFELDGIDVDLGDVPMLSTLASNAQYTLLGIEAEPETGEMQFLVSNGVPEDGVDLSGVTVSLDPDEGDGPLYLTTLGLPSTDEDATTENGGGTWLNLPAGDYSTDFDGLPAGCSLVTGWGSSRAPDFEIIRAYTTYLHIDCAEEE
ncbi:MAG: hypothetical protein KC912_12010 [Proteobacteria bacterium]|nr:hypothetical protein [Pseudomonadota bacterium]